MALLTFTFTVNPESKEYAFAGNIDVTSALHILQDLLISTMQVKEKGGNNEDKHLTAIINKKQN
jgi:hypothetical protein